MRVFLSILATLALLLVSTTTALAAREPGPASGDACPADDLVAGVTPADAMGTTFVGTYVGDSLAGGRSEEGVLHMLSFWAVEQVYAGGPLPADLVVQTPECAWANLTPGVRYLFSTAATDPSFAERTPGEEVGRPSVADSLAWELLADGAVRLAPFDTYAVEDYGEDVRSIETFEAALAAVAPGAGKGEEPAAPIDMGFGCLAAVQPPLPDGARGTTFRARYIGHERLPSGGVDDLRVHWSVERVYAGGPLPEILTLRSDGCIPVRLTPGARYLFSTSDLAQPGADDSLAWRLERDGGVRLARFDDITADLYPQEVRQIRSLDAALEAVAPGAGEGETPLRSADRTPG